MSDFREYNMEVERELIFSKYNAEISKLDKSYCLNIQKVRKISDNAEIIIELPFWIGKILDVNVPLNYIRALSLGNLWGTLYVLIQDKYIDNQNEDNDTTSKWSSFILLNLIYYKWIKEYQRVFRSDNNFWALFEKYLIEFTNALKWEKIIHHNKIASYADNDLLRLGQKMSLLKISAAGMCLLGNKKEMINVFSDIIDSYHMGFQFTDDLKDWEEDLKDHNYTYFLVKIFKEYNNKFEFGQFEDMINKTNILESVIDKSNKFYNDSLSKSKLIGCKDLVKFIENKKIQNKILFEVLKYGKERFFEEITGKANILPEEIYILEEIHLFKYKGLCLLYDINRSLSVKLTNEMYGFIKSLSKKKCFSGSWILKVCSGNNIEGKSQILNELLKMKLLKLKAQSIVESKAENKSQYTKDSILTSLGICISSNTRDKIKVISYEKAKNSINHMLIKSRQFPHLSLYLFCANNFDSNIDKLLNKISAYSQKLATKLYKDLKIISVFDFRILFRKSSLELLINSELNEIIIDINSEIEKYSSCDIDQCVEHILILIHNGKKVMLNITAPENQQKMKRFKKIYIKRSNTYHANEVLLNNTENNCRNCICNLQPSIQFRKSISVERIIDRLRKHKQYKHYCNAGKSYVVISADGEYYPCYRFEQSGINKMGKLASKVDEIRQKYISSTIQNKPLCVTCWARNICGGGCLFKQYLNNRNSNKTDVEFCNDYKSLIEKAIYLRANSSKENSELRYKERIIDLRECDYIS